MGRPFAFQEGMKKVFQIGENESSQRLDRFLRKEFPKAALSFLQKAIRTGRVKVDGKKAKGLQMLQPGQSVSVFFAADHFQVEKSPAKDWGRIAGSKFFQTNFKPIFEDESFLAVAKPAGLAVHGGSKIFSSTLLDLVCAHIFQANPAATKPHPLHRLDRETSGVVLFAKNVRAAREGSRLFQAQNGRVRKFYRALLCGNLQESSGEIRAKICVESSGAKVANSENAKAALTKFRVERRAANFTLVRVEILTGRKRQIRAHFAHLGFPVAGDSRFAPPSNFPVKTFPRLLLHGESLTFTHPFSGRQVCLEAKLPLDFHEFLDRIF